MSNKFRPTLKKGPAQRTKRRRQQTPANVFEVVKAARLGKFTRRGG